MVEIVAIGGSAGSLQTIISIIEMLPPKFDFAVVLVIHRLKNVVSDMTSILAENNRNINLREPEDKMPVKNSCVYLAPQNYHLLIEEDRTFSLDYSEPINHSRPSIDATLEGVADVYGDAAVAILLSGASNDGAHGMAKVIRKGGVGIVHDPAEAEYPIMPQSAIDKSKNIIILNRHEIVTYINNVII